MFQCWRYMGTRGALEVIMYKSVKSQTYCAEAWKVMVISTNYWLIICACFRPCWSSDRLPCHFYGYFRQRNLIIMSPVVPLYANVWTKYFLLSESTETLMTSFDNDGILQLLIRWRHNVIAAEMTSSVWLEAIRFDWSSSVKQKTKMSIVYRIPSIRINRNGKIDERTLLIEDASWPVVKISARTVTSNRKLSKIWSRAEDIRRRKATHSLLGWLGYRRVPFRAGSTE